MNFGELKDETSELLNFNSGQTDQDFTAAQIGSAVNRAYRREYVRARQEGVKEWFILTTDITWAAAAATVTVASSLQGAQIIKIMDITSGLPGTEMIFSDTADVGDLSWKDRVTLQWGTTGPASQKTLRIIYFPVSEKMTSDSDVPALVSEEHHELIFYSAAIDLRNRADEMAPQAWLFERESLRQDYWKDISRSRPHSDVVGVAKTVSGLQGFNY